MYFDARAAKLLALGEHLVIHDCAGLQLAPLLCHSHKVELRGVVIRPAATQMWRSQSVRQWLALPPPRMSIRGGGAIHTDCLACIGGSLAKKRYWQASTLLEFVMPRPILDEAHMHPAIRSKVAGHQQAIVQEVMAAVGRNDVVVVGMGWNPFPKKACKALDAINQPYKYLEYGNYLNTWRERNALKMWTGWPTFPMVFVKGVLVGGASELQALIDRGELLKMVQAG